MIVAMHVRNAMEGFHVDHLSDVQMAELNVIIRQALFDVVSMIERPADNEDATAYLIKMIPDYWEVPSDEQQIVKRVSAVSGDWPTS